MEHDHFLNSTGRTINYFLHFVRVALTFHRLDKATPETLTKDPIYGGGDGMRGILGRLS